MVKSSTEGYVVKIFYVISGVWKHNAKIATCHIYVISLVASWLLKVEFLVLLIVCRLCLAWKRKNLVEPRLFDFFLAY